MVYNSWNKISTKTGRNNWVEPQKKPINTNYWKYYVLCMFCLEMYLCDLVDPWAEYPYWNNSSASIRKLVYWSRKRCFLKPRGRESLARKGRGRGGQWRGWILTCCCFVHDSSATDKWGAHSSRRFGAKWDFHGHWEKESANHPPSK